MIIIYFKGKLIFVADNAETEWLEAYPVASTTLKVVFSYYVGFFGGGIVMASQSCF